MYPFRKKTTKPHISCRPRHTPSKPFQALILIAAALLFFAALWDFPDAQSTEQSSHLVGALGIHTAEWAYALLGAAAWLLPFYLLWFGGLYLCRCAHRIRWQKLICVLASLMAASGLFDMVAPQAHLDSIETAPALPNGLGGEIGFWIYSHTFEAYLGPLGSTVILVLTLTLSLLALFFDNLETAFDNGVSRFSLWRQNRKDTIHSTPIARRNTKRTSVDSEHEVRPESKDIESPEGLFVHSRGNPPRLNAVSVPSSPTVDFAITTDSATKESDGLRIITGENVEKATLKLPNIRGDYQFPDPNLLQPPKTHPTAIEDHHQRAQTLQRVLSDFGITVEIGDVHTGPVITRYDIFPAPGVRVEKIGNLDKNIAMNLKAEAVRILAPVPGRGCVGVEIPNTRPASVCIREILESTAWAEAKAVIPLALGKEVSGRPYIADLARMPHLLIAGATGAGKTVCINSIITSLLYYSGPEDLRFLMVDPKIVEMQVYNDLPHMLIPVVTEPKKVPGALKWLLSEMERRYQIFAKVGARNIAGFNSKQAASTSKSSIDIDPTETYDADLSPEERIATQRLEVPRDPDIDVPDKLPYIVCIIDELADLMMVAPADIETSIARLAQLARAAGIHLIVATQRPSVNVITGVIKANLPSRIAFKVASKVDSRTILDGGGADQLIGRGDMLLIPPGMAQTVRIQGAFVSDDEINGIVDFLKRTNGPPQYAEEVQRHIDREGDDADNGQSKGNREWDDDLIPDALEILRSSKRASTSMFQRRLKIGYNRAARIMEILEREQIVGPDNGQQPREILKDIELL